jgi:hypothetical protein
VHKQNTLKGDNQMVEKQTRTIVINDKEYTEDQLSDRQKVIINHLNDLERKIGSTQFNLDQLNVGRQAFLDMLVVSLEEDTTTEDAEVLQ